MTDDIAAGLQQISRQPGYRALTDYLNEKIADYTKQLVVGHGESGESIGRLRGAIKVCNDLLDVFEQIKQSGFTGL